MKQREEHERRRDDDDAGAEPLVGSGFEQELPETDLNGDSEASAEPEGEDQQ